MCSKSSKDEAISLAFVRENEKWPRVTGKEGKCCQCYLCLSSTWYFTEELLAAGREPDPTDTRPQRQKLSTKVGAPANCQDWSLPPGRLYCRLSGRAATAGQLGILSPQTSQWPLPTTPSLGLVYKLEKSTDDPFHPMPSRGKLGSPPAFQTLLPFHPQNSRAQSPSGRTASP